jgi:hypothetical protein
LQLPPFFALGAGTAGRFGIGRKALGKEVSNRSRKMVTLEWNHEDILDVSRLGFKFGLSAVWHLM